MQEAFALTLQDTFIASLEKFAAEFKEYEALKKKLESRRYVGRHVLHGVQELKVLDRLSLDAAIARLEKAKGGKKEKEKREAEEEHEKARLRLYVTLHQHLPLLTLTHPLVKRGDFRRAPGPDAQHPGQRDQSVTRRHRILRSGDPIC
jgi:hypothetical protein